MQDEKVRKQVLSKESQREVRIMTREEQIIQAALAYSFDTDGGHSGDLSAGRDDFIDGAVVADGGRRSGGGCRKVCRRIG